MSDVILRWNEVALRANLVSHTFPGGTQLGPTLSSRAMGIVHLAMYDAYAAVVNDPANLPPYLPGLPPPPPGSTASAAVAGAAYTALVALFPAQVADFNADLAALGDPANAGHAFGVQVATALLADRAGDPDASDAGYTPSPLRGRHRADPDNPRQGFHGPFYGARSKGFAITQRWTLDEPPQPGESGYLAALRQVREKGIRPDLFATLPDVAFKRRRTPDETLIGIYWGYDGAVGLGTPPRLYNQIIRKIATARGNTEAENARLFALVNTAMADAGILAWDQKFIWDLWRPVVGIREHDESFGPQPSESDNNINNDADPGWLPLGAPQSNALNPGLPDPVAGPKNFTPPFPAYPSGHATFGAAAFHITRLFYGVTNRGNDNLLQNLFFVSDEYNGVNEDNAGTVRPNHQRDFPGGLWQMIVENGISRVFLGVHWVFDAFAAKNNGDPDLSENVGGVPLGLRIAEDIFNGGRAAGLKKSPVGPRTV